jgi:hypothetical protein
MNELSYKNAAMNGAISTTNVIWFISQYKFYPPELPQGIEPVLLHSEVT